MELGGGASQDPRLRVDEVLTSINEPSGEHPGGFELFGYKMNIRDARVARSGCFPDRHRFDSGGVVWAARMLP